ncbi:hypothetical protein MnTg02_02833 [bacterium MnTg02]|nr:hypothetical protein MnTg02_02833 [bacterium MnTg02]
MDPAGVHFHYHRGLLVFFAIGAAGLVAIGAYFAAAASPWGSDAPEGLFFILFFGCVLIFTVRAWFDTDPVVEIGPTGIRDRRMGNQLIPWDAISAVRGFGVWDNRLLKVLRFLSGFSKHGNRFLGIITDDPNQFYHPRNPIAGFLGRINLLVGYPLLNINMGPLDGTYDDLVVAVRQFAQDKGIDIRT